ncbi:MAG: CvpA family protein [Candidatus Omnitrophica bacterium]|nr:CvpA family protein [Candidatus Omnitrophota bacterium]
MGLLDILSRINWVDVLILTILFRICYVGFNRGLANEAVPLIGIYAALVISLHFYAPIGNFISGFTSINKNHAYVLCFVSLAAFTNYVFSIIEAYIVSKVMQIHVASLLDRIGGLFFGILRGILLASVVITALELIPIKYLDDSIYKRSLLGTRFLNIAKGAHNKTFSFLGVR